MPAKTRKQQRLMGADLARARAGKKTRTGMSEAKLEEMATMKHGKHEMPKGTKDTGKMMGEEKKSGKKYKGKGRKKK